VKKRHGKESDFDGEKGPKSGRCRKKCDRWLDGVGDGAKKIVDVFTNAILLLFFATRDQLSEIAAGLELHPLSFLDLRQQM
jgi:hypothetical protein